MIPIRDENPTRRPAIVTGLLIAVCLGVFLFVQPTASQILDEPTADELVDEIEFTYEYAAVPCELIENRPLTAREITATQVNGELNACASTPGSGSLVPFPDKNIWVSVIVSIFLHGSWLHIAGNMIFLWIFGNNIEDHMGRGHFAVFFLMSGIIATLAHVAVQLDSTVPVVGASGAVAGVMGVYLVWFPRARVRTLVFITIIPLWPRLPAAVLLVVWFVSQFYIGNDSGVAWMAHVAGFIFGVVAGLVGKNERLRT